MTTPTLAELIERATPGPWTAASQDGTPSEEFVYRPDGSWVAIVPDKNERQLIARCNPATMKVVLERLEEIKRRTYQLVAVDQGTGTEDARYKAACDALSHLSAPGGEKEKDLL